MDLWVVAAAAGAGYLAKNWKNLLVGDKDCSEELFSEKFIQDQSGSSNLFEQTRDQSYPFRRLAPKREKIYVFSKKKDNVLDTNDVGSSSRMLDDVSGNVGTDEYAVHQLAKNNLENREFADADRIGDGNVLGSVGIDEYNVHWLGGENVMENVDAINKHCRFKNSKFLWTRIRPGYAVRPSDSLESCLAAQLCREHEKMKEYVYSSPCSPSVQVLRPLLVTDGSRLISRATDAHDGNDELYGLQQTPKIGCIREQVRSFSDLLSERPSNPSGNPHGMISFFMGITIGILSVVMANKREVDRLNKQLKQSQNLVQDVSEELDLKDAVTVRDLVNETSQPPGVYDLSHSHCQPSNLSSGRFGEISKYDGKKQSAPMVENSESRNKIEAELEAELERLELNLKASSLERIADYVEVDPDLEPAYYAVSPRELRLRLHEVIEARLEAQIKELETALQSSENRLHSLESLRGFTQSEAEFSSTPQSLVYVFQDNDGEEPLLINLAGNALDAYIEVYPEMLSMTDSDNETAQALHDGNCFMKEIPPSGTKLSNFPSFRENETTSGNFVREDRVSMSVHRVHMRTSEVQTSRSLRSSEEGNSDDEDDQELDMLLIKRIV